MTQHTRGQRPDNAKSAADSTYDAADTIAQQWMDKKSPARGKHGRPRKGQSKRPKLGRCECCEKRPQLNPKKTLPWKKEAVRARRRISKRKNNRETQRWREPKEKILGSDILSSDHSSKRKVGFVRGKTPSKNEKRRRRDHIKRNRQKLHNALWTRALLMPETLLSSFFERGDNHLWNFYNLLPEPMGSKENKDQMKKLLKTHRKIERDKNGKKRANKCSKLGPSKEALEEFHGKTKDHTIKKGISMQTACASGFTFEKTVKKKGKREHHQLVIRQKVCARCREEGRLNQEEKFSWWSEAEVEEGGEEKPVTPPTPMTAEAGGATEVGVNEAAAAEQKGAISHQYYDAKEQRWKKGSLPHGTVTVDIKLDKEMYNLGQKEKPEVNWQCPLRNEAKAPTIKMKCVIDTGTQITAMGRHQAENMGIDCDALHKPGTGITSISGERVTPIGSFYAEITGRCVKGRNSSTIRTKEVVYVFEKTPNPYLSRAVLVTLGIVKEYMNIGDFLKAGAAEAQDFITCTEVRDEKGNRQCNCPSRELVPDEPEWEGEATDADIPAMRRLIIRHYAASALNVCKLQPQPKMSGLPPVKLHIDMKRYKPVKVTQASNVPLHLEEAARKSVDQDLQTGIIEKVPVEENTSEWGTARQVIVAKPTKPGEPQKIRRTVDYKALNAFIDPAVWHCDPPLKQAERVPSGAYKTVLDARDGFHSVPLHPESKKYTHFITSTHGILRCNALPQGLITSPAAFNQRMSEAEDDGTGKTAFPKSTRLMDDTIIWEEDLREMFRATCKYLTQIGRAGISFNPKKFQFAQKEVDYVGFRIHPEGLSVSEKILKSIKEFPRPRNLKDMRSFMGLAEQTAPFLAKAEQLHPFRDLLKSKSKEDFVWTPELEKAFQHAKNHLIQESEEGIKRFSMGRTTLITTDWSKMGMAATIFQKYCTCEQEDGTRMLGCCPDGWKLVLMDSRFCSTSEANYAPIEGEICALYWALSKFRYFVIGHPDLILAVDHQPLLGTLNQNKDLTDLINHRIIEFSRKIGCFQPYQLVHIPGIRNHSADAGSRFPVGEADDTDMDGVEEMLTGAASKIMEEAYTDENLGPAHQEDTSEVTKGPKTFNGIMLAGIHLRMEEACDILGKEEEIEKSQVMAAAATAMTYENTTEEMELSQEIEAEEREHIHASLQAATGCFDEMRAPQAVTVHKLMESAKEDREYVTLQKLLTNNLPWGGGMQELQTGKKETVNHPKHSDVEQQGGHTTTTEGGDPQTPTHRPPGYYITPEEIGGHDMVAKYQKRSGRHEEDMPGVHRKSPKPAKRKTERDTHTRIPLPSATCGLLPPGRQGLPTHYRRIHLLAHR